MSKKVCLLGMLAFLMLFTVGINSATATTIASWPSEWAANNQGANNWYYLYRTSSNPNTTYSLPWQSSSGVYGWSTDLHIGSDGGCLPNSAMTLWPVLRWESEVAGTIQIVGSVTRVGTQAFSPTGTDGCIATILVNGVEKWSYNWTAVNTAAQPFDITVSGVAVGDTVDFVVNPKVNNNWGDECKWNIAIAVPEPVSMMMMATGGLLLFRRKTFSLI